MELETLSTSAKVAHSSPLVSDWRVHRHETPWPTLELTILSAVGSVDTIQTSMFCRRRSPVWLVWIKYLLNTVPMRDVIKFLGLVSIIYVGELSVVLKAR